MYSIYHGSLYHGSLYSNVTRRRLVLMFYKCVLVSQAISCDLQTQALHESRVSSCGTAGINSGPMQMQLC